MKEVVEVPEPQLTCKVKYFVVDKIFNVATAVQNCHTFQSHSGWINVSFNDNVIFNDCVSNKVMEWNVPVSKDPDPATVDTFVFTSHTALAGLENDDHLQYFLNS